MAAEAKTMPLASSWREFTEEVTMHGIRYTFMKQASILRRIIWGLCILACLYYFCSAAYTLVSHYMRQPVSTKLSLVQIKSMNFPAITICNHNKFRKSVIDWFTVHQSPGLPEILEELYLTDSQERNSNKFNWSDPIYSIYNTFPPSDWEGILKVLSHPLKESLLECKLKNQLTPCSDLFKVVRTTAGFCYQFNSAGNYSSNTAGKSGGIQVTLDAKPYEYYTGPTSMSTGFDVVLTEPEEVALVDELSIGVPVGSHTIIKVSKSTHSKKPPPADDNRSQCFDSQNLPNNLTYYNSWPYSFAACFTECKTKFIVKRCGCRDPFQPDVDNATACLFQAMINCSSIALEEFTHAEDGLDSCHCPYPCIDTEYSGQVSSYTFPSVYYMQKAGISDLASIRESYTTLNIFYGKMSYQKIEEEFSYNGTDLLADAGGTLGLCIGASLLTLVEFIQYVLLLLIGRCPCKKKKPSSTKIQVTPYTSPDVKR